MARFNWEHFQANGLIKKTNNDDIEEGCGHMPAQTVRLNSNDTSSGDDDDGTETKESSSNDIVGNS